MAMGKATDTAISRSGRARHTTSSKTQPTNCQTTETTSTGTSTMGSIWNKINKMIKATKIFTSLQPNKKISVSTITMGYKSQSQSHSSLPFSNTFSRYKSRIHINKPFQSGGRRKRRIRRKTGKTSHWRTENL